MPDSQRYPYTFCMINSVEDVVVFRWKTTVENNKYSKL